MIPQKWLDWVDTGTGQSDASFKARRLFRLFLVCVFGPMILGSPTLILKYLILQHEQAEKERERQEQLQRDWEVTEKAAKEGKTGEAFRRLFGVQGDS